MGVGTTGSDIERAKKMYHGIENHKEMGSTQNRVTDKSSGVWFLCGQNGSQRSDCSRSVSLASGVADADSVGILGGSRSGHMKVSARSGALRRQFRRRVSSQAQKFHAGASMAQPAGSVNGAKSNKGGSAVALSSSNQNTEQHRCNAV